MNPGVHVDDVVDIFLEFSHLIELCVYQYCPRQVDKDIKFHLLQLSHDTITIFFNKTHIELNLDCFTKRVASFKSQLIVYLKTNMHLLYYQIFHIIRVGRCDMVAEAISLH